MTYTHLTQDERYQIHTLKRERISLACIAAELQRSPSTISRELKRNAGPIAYKPALAHTTARARQTQRRNAHQFSPEQWSHVDAYLRLDLSPQQCSGRLLLEHALDISHECIYQHVYKDKAQGQERRGTLKNRVSIEQRPAVVDKRSRIGDWEGDTVIGKGHQGVLVTLVERKSRYTLATRLDSRHSNKVTQAIIALLGPHKQQCKTLTFDNGKEFAEHAFIAKCLEAKVYFAHPYCSWERGLNENHNGLLRQFFPKETNLLKVTQDEVNEVVYRLNHRPRKCLGYMTPHEVFYGLEMRPLKLPTDALCS
jgi:transposase, IS30 family